MRWIRFIILSYAMLVVQTSIVGVLAFSAGRIGTVQPDLLAVLAVFVAITVRTASHAMLAAMALGLGLDLMAGGSAVPLGAVGVAYSLAAWLVFQARDVFFREQAVAQGLLCLVFCLVSHCLYTVLQLLWARGVGWSDCGALLLQALCVAVYTAVLAPLGVFLLGKVSRVLIVMPSGERRRGR